MTILRSGPLGLLGRGVSAALLKSGLQQRDTDKDWKALGDNEPYWGVLTDERFRTSNLESDGIGAFYKTGVQEIATLVQQAEQIIHHPVRATRALDFGCGVGRLTEAMSAYSDHVVGVDVSEGMLSQARSRQMPRTSYVAELPNERFDWINSFIVFQHIPPARGLKLLEQLLERAAPFALLTLHFCIYSEALHMGEGRFQPKRLDGSWRHRWMTASRPRGTVMMYEYDLTEIFRRLTECNFHVMSLLHTDHGGHHGAQIISERRAV